MAIKLIHLVCDVCRAVVNKVEYDPDARQAKVDQIASTLGITAEEADTYVTAHNADPQAQAEAYAAQLANHTDSPCPAGHTGNIQVVPA